MLDEFYFPTSTDTLFLHLPLPASAQTNATRFRLWQPYNSGEWTLFGLVKKNTRTQTCRNVFALMSLLFFYTGKKEEVWVIDDLIIDGSSLHNPPVLIDSFDEGPNDSNWLFFPGGNTGLYCPYQKTGL